MPRRARTAMVSISALGRHDEMVAAALEVDAGESRALERLAHAALGLDRFADPRRQAKRTAREVKPHAVDDRVGRVNLAFHVAATELLGRDLDRMERQPQASARS